MLVVMVVCDVCLPHRHLRPLWCWDLPALLTSAVGHHIPSDKNEAGGTKQRAIITEGGAQQDRRDRQDLSTSLDHLAHLKG